jgi:hypothetical protein
LNHFTVPIAIFIFRKNSGIRRLSQTTVESHHRIERRAVRRLVALGDAGRTMKKPTRLRWQFARDFTSFSAP